MWLPLKEDAGRLHTAAGAVTVALVGNPNAGKTAIFNRLTGLAQKVGNYPGVTVERKEGRARIGEVPVRFLDLPGTYSLAAHSPDEQVTVDVLLGHQSGESRPDLVLQVVDASNPARNLYLLSQVLETGLPVVVALNMMDVAAARGLDIDASLLSERLGVPVVPVEGHRGTGMDDLRRALGATMAGLEEKGPVSSRGRAAAQGLPMDTVREPMDALRESLGNRLTTGSGRVLHDVEILRAIIDRGGYAENRLVEIVGADVLEKLESARTRVTICMPLAAYEASHRYGWIHERLDGCVRRLAAPEKDWSERFDRVLTHKVAGFVVFGTVMLVVFQAIFTWARPLMQSVEALFGWLQMVVASVLPAGPLQSLLCDGVIAGVGMVVMFLPQILILFLFIGLLEDCGYMARAAFLMDRVMSKCGLSGKSFIPMLSGFACAVPGILAARVIPDRRDRFATMLVTPLMSCSARLPVYAVFIGTFVPEKSVIPGILGLQALTLFGLYALGIVTAVGVAWVLRKTLLRGMRPPFVLELPSYKWPSPTGLLLRLRDRGREFLVRAGTAILAIAVVVWALAYFPRSEEIAAGFERQREHIQSVVSPGEGREAALEQLESLESRAYLADSYFARMGKAVEPVFEPLGWDWRISMAVLASFPAREVLVSTLGTVFHLGEDDEDPEALRASLRKATRPSPGGGAGEEVRLFTLPVALSILVFFALCCQCGATVVTLGREMGSWLWAAFGFGYMTGLAYVGALLTYQIAGVFGT